MQLSELKTLFISRLDKLYSSDEVQSLFQLGVQKILGMSRLATILKPHMDVQQEALERFLGLISALEAEQPIQYFFEETVFCDLTFKVNQHVLIPRPETEELVHLVLDVLAKQPVQPPITILDIGTGSGCIAVSLAKRLTDAKIFAMDVSKEALSLAKENARLNEASVTYLEYDILNSETRDLRSEEALDFKWNAIVSNPPYVRESEKALMNNNVLKYEPGLALFVSDNDPLVFYRHIVEFAKVNLKSKGWLFFEINQYLAEEMQLLLKNYKFNEISVIKDLFGEDRFIKAQFNG